MSIARSQAFLKTFHNIPINQDIILNILKNNFTTFAIVNEIMHTRLKKRIFFSRVQSEDKNSLGLFYSFSGQWSCHSSTGLRHRHLINIRDGSIKIWWWGGGGMCTPAMEAGVTIVSTLASLSSLA